MTTTEQERLVGARSALHGIAECLLAGPQHRACGEIALRITPGGFATTGAPALRLDGQDLVRDERDRIPIVGNLAAVAGQVGVDFGAPDLGYPDGSNAAAADAVDLDPVSARIITSWLLLADAALRVLAPDRVPVLWPEHFDVAVLLHDHSFGASPGDDGHPDPYAYVSAPDHPADPFWNAPFGALLDHRDVGSLEDLASFWRRGLELVTIDR